MPEASVERIRHKFNRINTLPPLPRTASQLLGALADPDVEIDDIVAILEQDPALVARILGLANSAYFGQQKAITQVQQAIIRVLGINLVKSLALSISLAGVFDTKACKAFRVADYWYMALGSASLSRVMVQCAPLAEVGAADRAYLTALLHNLGMLLLANISPLEMSQALEQHQQEPGHDLLELEREYVGIDHFAAGEWLLKRWHLPEVVVDIVGHLKDEDYNGSYRSEWGSVRAAVEFVATQMTEEGSSLSPDAARILGLDESKCAEISEKYREQTDSLRSVAQALN